MCKVLVLITRAHVTNLGTQITILFKAISPASLICCLTFAWDFLLIFFSLMSEVDFEFFKKIIRIDCMH